jgi:hypothetical protein
VKPIAALLIAVFCGSVVTGCGDDDNAGDRRAAEDVVERFGAAFAARDGRRICDDLLAAELRRSVEAVGLTCEQAIGESAKAVRRPRIEVLGSGVEGDRGYVTVRSTAAGQEPSIDRITLRRSGDEWRITALNTGEELAPGEKPEVSKPTPLGETTAD